MTINPNGDPQPEIVDAPELIQVINTYDLARAELYTAFDDYAKAPNEENLDNMALCSLLTIRAFGSSVEAFGRAEPRDLEKRVELIAALMVGDDIERVGRLQGITKCTHFKESRADVDPDIKGRLMSAALDGDAGFNEAVASMYLGSVDTDLAHFIDHFVEQPNEESELSRTQRVARAVGKTAFDVAKIGAGVAIGIWVMNRKRPH
jgi:hypothetical protein